MSGASSIEWTDATWNPVRGCSMAKGSETGGCLNCYAARLAARNMPGMRSPTTGEPFARMLGSGPRWTGRVELIPSALDWPLRKRKPLRIFVNSMSDLFHEKLSNEAIAAVFGVMALAESHTFQVLTKRPERMREWFRWIESNPLFAGKSRAKAERLETGPAHACIVMLSALGPKELNSPLFTAHMVAGMVPGPETKIRKNWPLPNVWLGVSVENQATADERIPLLLQTPAAKRFVSYEPALGPVDFSCIWFRQPGGETLWNALRSSPPDAGGKWAGIRGLDWLIVGGESGPGARPFDVAWARSTVEQCKSAGVAVFVKQLGARPYGLGTDLRLARVTDREDAKNDLFSLGLRDRKGGDWSEWPEDLRVREFPL